MLAPDLLPAQSDELRRLLASYWDIFDPKDRPLGKASSVTHRINTGSESPIHKRPYRVFRAGRGIIEQEVDKILAKDIIEPSCSPWASPVVLVKKKDGAWRFGVDYRHLKGTQKSLL